MHKQRVHHEPHLYCQRTSKIHCMMLTVTPRQPGFRQANPHTSLCNPTSTLPPSCQPAPYAQLARLQPQLQQPRHINTPAPCHYRATQDMLGSLGAVEVLLAALQLFCSGPQHSKPAADAMQALHYVCLMNPINTARLASCNGMQLVKRGERGDANKPAQPVQHTQPEQPEH